MQKVFLVICRYLKGIKANIIIKICSSSYNNKRDNNNNTLEKNNKYQTEYNEEQRLRVIRKQDQITGRLGAKLSMIFHMLMYSMSSKGFRISSR